MSIRWMAALVAGVWSITALAQQAAPQQQLPAMDKNKLSYALGFQIGTDMRERGLDVDIATVVRALQEGHANSQPSVPMEEMVGQLAAMEDKLRKEAEAKFNTLAAENKAKSDRFLAENRAKKGIIVLPSGIQYRVIEEGNGARPSPTSVATRWPPRSPRGATRERWVCRWPSGCRGGAEQPPVARGAAASLPRPRRRSGCSSAARLRRGVGRGG